MVKRRRRGHIQLRSNGRFRAYVYAGRDPITKKERYLSETVRTYDEAERALTRLLAQVDREYGIQRPVRDLGFLCESVDQDVFTGDVLDRIKSQIEAASAVIAVLTGANPNVYLEVGYAWGKGQLTILLTDEGEDLRFDVRGRRLARCCVPAAWWPFKPGADRANVVGYGTSSHYSTF
jgi:hypothetical protein